MREMGNGCCLASPLRGREILEPQCSHGGAIRDRGAPISHSQGRLAESSDAGQGCRCTPTPIQNYVNDDVYFHFVFLRILLSEIASLACDPLSDLCSDVAKVSSQPDLRSVQVLGPCFLVYNLMHNVPYRISMYP